MVARGLRFALACLCLVCLAASGEEKKTPAPDGSMTFTIVNKTGGKYSDEQIFWTLNGKDFKPMSQSNSVTVGKKPGGRLYISLGAPMKDMAGRESYFDFIEYTLNQSGFHGNTTQVDAFGIPITLELVDADGKSKSVGISEPRT